MENSIEIVIIFIFVCIAIFFMFDTINTANYKKKYFTVISFTFTQNFQNYYNV